MKHLLTLALVLCLGTFASAQIPSYVPTNGLVGWWPFNGNANDESGNGNHGTVNGNISFVQDRFSINQNSVFVPGGGPFNNGLGNYIKINSWTFSTQNSPRSYVVWTKVMPNQTGSTILSAGINNNYSCNELWSFNVSNTGDCAVQGISVNTNCSQKKYYQNFADGNWHMWALTYNGVNGFSGIQYYFDGKLLNTTAGSCTQGIMYPSFQSQPGEMYFGMGNLSNAGSFEGCLDDIAIYNRALTPAEVQQLYLGNSSNTSAASTVPGKIHYQGVAVGANGKPIKNGTVGLRLSVLDSLPNGITLYTETQIASTDAAGIFSTYLGDGPAIAGAFANIPWANGNNKFLKVEMDAQGGTNYQPMGTPNS